MEIVINPLDPESVANAVLQLEEYKKSLAEKQNTLITDAVRTGADVANQVYAQHPGDHGIASAFYEVANGEGVITAVAPDGEIGFIEFGTGIRHDIWGRNFNNMPPYSPPEHGSYGNRQGEDPGYWWYGGEYTDGRDPANAMLFARQQMIESVLDNAREVFRS